MAELKEEVREEINECLRENAELKAKVQELLISYEELLLHSIPEMEDLGGIVVHPDIAAQGPCGCYGNVCFHKGIIGALNASERGQYCHEVEEESSPAMTKRIQHWDAAVQVCKGEIAGIPKGNRLEPWLQCMGKELPKHGITLS